LWKSPDANLDMEPPAPSPPWLSASSACLFPDSLLKPKGRSGKSLRLYRREKVSSPTALPPHKRLFLSSDPFTRFSSNGRIVSLSSQKPPPTSFRLLLPLVPPPKNCPQGSSSTLSLPPTALSLSSFYEKLFNPPMLPRPPYRLLPSIPSKVKGGKDVFIIDNQGLSQIH
jgi:hypothetical protein